PGRRTGPPAARRPAPNARRAGASRSARPPDRGTPLAPRSRAAPRGAAAFARDQPDCRYLASSIDTLLEGAVSKDREEPQGDPPPDRLAEGLGSRHRAAAREGEGR